MLCDDCKKRQATYHEVTEVNGYRTDVHLCEECMRKRGYKTDMSVFDSFFNGFGFDDFFALPSSTRSRAVCSKCGKSLEEFTRTGLLGCENCYDEFASYILPHLNQTQAKVLHVGKKPGKKEKKVNPEYEKLKKELSAAVEAEEYEKAAQIQAKIKEMEKESA